MSITSLLSCVITLARSNQLDIPLIEVDHKGHYVCYADNGIGEPATSNVILEVQFPPEIHLPASRVCPPTTV